VQALRATENDGRPMDESFSDRFVELFHAHFPHLFRYLDRLSGDPDLAADLAQDAFVRLYARGSSPDFPEAWLITVGTNLLRNARSKASRHARLLTEARGAELVADPDPSPVRTLEAGEVRQRVRAALEAMPERDRRMLLLRAEGYGYRAIAAALELNESSIGTLLARAKHAFRTIYEESLDAPRG
jgi:RNA polymerase sigma factor (sigma-70 family)